MSLQTIDDIIFDSCQYLNNNPDSDGKILIDNNELLNCEKKFEFSFDSNNPSIQANILNNLENTFNPKSGLFEKCKNQINKRTCLNTVLQEEVQLFGNKLFGNKEDDMLKKNRNKFNNLQSDSKKIYDELKDLQKKPLSSLTKELIDEKEIQINDLNKNINNIIGNYREDINETYNDKLNTQYNSLIYYYKLIEANKEIIERLKDKSILIDKKNEIIIEKKESLQTSFYILISGIILLFGINILLYILFVKKN
jgi:hypothetical protein